MTRPVEVCTSRARVHLLLDIVRRRERWMQAARIEKELGYVAAMKRNVQLARDQSRLLVRELAAI